MVRPKTVRFGSNIGVPSGIVSNRQVFENDPSDDSCLIEKVEYTLGNKRAVLEIWKDNKHRRIISEARGYENGELLLNKGYHLGRQSRKEALHDIKNFLNK